MSITKIKILKFWLLILIFGSFNIEAAYENQEIVLLSDSTFNSHFFGATWLNNNMQLFQKIKPFGASTWDPAEIISDPLVSLNSYKVKKDANDNFMIAWIGVNTNLQIYSLYIRYYVALLGTWSPITMVSGNTENLTGNYSISINTQEAEIIWSSYDNNFDIEYQSATFIL